MKLMKHKIQNCYYLRRKCYLANISGKRFYSDLGAMYRLLPKTEDDILWEPMRAKKFEFFTLGKFRTKEEFLDKFSEEMI